MNTCKLVSSVAIGFVVLLGPQSTMADNQSHWREESHSYRHRPSHHVSQRADQHRYDYRYKDPEPHYKPYYQPGYHVNPLPRGHSRLFVNSLEYFFFDGFFYRPYRNGYVVVDAPMGAIIAQLPHFSRLMHWHGQPYYAVGNTYYRPHHRGGFVVVPDPGFAYRR